MQFGDKSLNHPKNKLKRKEKKRIFINAKLNFFENFQQMK
jgi:hypothetical protein